MTLEDKRSILTDYCVNNGCDECKLGNCNIDYHSSWCACNSIRESSEEKINEGLALIGKTPCTEEPTEAASPTTHDPVNHPSHYTQGGMECIDEMVLIFGKEATAHFCLCNAWKYRARALYKNGEEDMQKSHWYLNKYKELMEVTV